MSPRRVLVVDDEAGIRQVLRGYLEREGFEVTEAPDGGSALRLAAAAGRQAPDVVLLDVGLPDLDGLEVLRRLRAVSDVYVILVTARVEEVDRLVGLGVGADDYVTKPFSPREVVARVKAGRRRARPPIPAMRSWCSPVWCSMSAVAKSRGTDAPSTCRRWSSTC